MIPPPSPTADRSPEPHPGEPAAGAHHPSRRRLPLKRLRSETVDLHIKLRDASGEERSHNLAVCLAVDDDYRLHELNFVTRGTIGAGLDGMLRELGIQISRAIQGRDPETGTQQEEPA